MKTHGTPHGQDLSRISCSSSTPHLIGRGLDRPVKTRGPSRGQGGAARKEPTFHGP